MRKKLPIGLQTFEKIIQDDYLYIDKTEIASNLIENYTYAFLSRPRRFGKSLFLDTLRNIFEGKKELFEGLAIYDKWDWSVRYPVIKISFSGDFQTLEGVKKAMFANIRANQERLELECSDISDAPSCFAELIRKASQKYKQRVVVLIDEYDKPILDAIDNIEQAKINREFIKSIYTVLKDSDEFIKFAFLTGVSKFSKASIFSGLNMLEDISLTPQFGNICGYTQNDIETTFAPYLQDVDMQKFQEWYNGYNFLKDPVYNPFDVLKFIKNDCKYHNYWFASGTPTFLIKLIKECNYFLPKLSNLVVDERLIDSFDIENIDLEVILYQSGYLTIEHIETTPFESIEYKLKVPNKEVQRSFNDYIIDTLLQQNVEKNIHKKGIYIALMQADMQSFENSLKAIFASIPYNNYTNNSIQNYEGFYASVIYIYLQSLGIEIIAEDVTSRGRIDLTCFVEDKIYIMEFKVDSTGALEQIKAKNYAQKYLGQNRAIYLVGIDFDSNEKNVHAFEVEKVI